MLVMKPLKMPLKLTTLFPIAPRTTQRVTMLSSESPF